MSEAQTLLVTLFLTPQGGELVECLVNETPLCHTELVECVKKRNDYSKGDFDRLSLTVRLFNGLNLVILFLTPQGGELVECVKNEMIILTPASTGSAWQRY